MIPLDQWLAGGERVRAGAHQLFCRVDGHGPWLTFLHGFPTSSWDWAAVTEELAHHHRLLCFDFLGFGDSDKPPDHEYSLREQADLTQELWLRFGIERTGIVAHDYGVSVAQELLARNGEGRLPVTLDGVVFLNGGLFPDLHRPLLVQKLLLRPLVGPLLGRLMSEALFTRSLRRVFAQPLGDSEAHQHWRAVCRRNGQRLYHRLIRYIPERRAQAARWAQALDAAKCSLRFVWGLEDPVSGAHVAAHLRTRLPGSRLVELPGIGHYPQLEAAETVVREVRDAFAAVPGPPQEPLLSPQEDEEFRKGVAEFNRGAFFECHDTLEELWSGLRGPARDFFQGLIQVAVAFYHLESGNRAGARSMLERASKRLARYPDSYAGFALGALRGELRGWRERLAQPADVALPAPPRWTVSQGSLQAS